ncbi:hypothetical protein [Arthrobacter sp. A2-55]|uniref:hypothetical protein n=1 Tax=Arthrobacter sp. A2-55 TaxID=2897337 RepID=UPI0021CDC2F8|nr:hypothetical protein [Arthrobacter sp. A2-55]MCU6479895.1 hypothetical protein [Arthrobacter sp. A2-55]
MTMTNLAPTRQTYGVDPGSTASSVALPLIDAPTRFTALRNTERAGVLVSRTTTLSNDVRANYIDALVHEWRILTTNRAATSVKELLELLAEQGFAWRDIARMIGVSVPAVQKWRRGEKASGDNRSRLASLVAAQDLIASKYDIQEIESWFETPLIGDVPVTPIDLWAAGEAFLVLEYASGQLTSEDALTRFDASWRVNYESQFETFRAEDGNISIRSKG